MVDFPQFYDPKRIGTLFYPDVVAIAQQASLANLRPASGDRQKVHLLIVDMQIDFCHQRGTLFVPGALADIGRLIEFIYRNAERITSISCSLDSHLPFQIFHPAWWVGPGGNHPSPFTIIRTRDLEEGRWRPVHEPEWSLQYVKRLEKEAKKELIIWPYHVPMGGIGSALDPELWSAVFWHSIARQSQPIWWVKGSLPKTEHYSIVQPEIEVPEDPRGKKDLTLLKTLESHDRVLVAGEASSHCVLETLEDLVLELSGRPDQIEKIHVLRDCTSAVLHPEVDFEAIARKQFAEFEKQGVRFIASTGGLPF